MSTKTNFKRVALVAVAALGLGVLTSVAPASAAPATLVLTAAGAGVQTSGVCVSTFAGAAVTTPNVMSVGGRQTVTYAQRSGQDDQHTYLVLTGPAKWISSASGAIQADGQTIYQATDLTAGASVFEVTGTGSIQVYVTVSATSAAALKKYVTAVASCTAGVSATKSRVQVVRANDAFLTLAQWQAIQADAGANASTGAITSPVLTRSDASDDLGSYTVGLDTNLDEATSFASGQTAYIAVLVRDAYGINNATAGTLGVACTNNVTVGGQKGGYYSQALTADTDNASVTVVAPTSGTPVSTVCTLNFNGVPLATKSIKFLGDVKSLTLTSYSNGNYSATSAANRSGYVLYTMKDSAGNAVGNSLVTSYSSNVYAVPTIVAATGTLVTNALTSDTIATGADWNPAAAETDGAMYFNCLNYGNSSISAYVVNAVGEVIASAPVDLRCGGTVFTYTASLDKASYATGDIATLTIVGKAKDGGALAYQVAHGGVIAVSGMTAVTAPVSTDASTKNTSTWKYTYTVNQTAGSYAASINIPVSSTSPQYNKPLTFSYKITDGGGVSNADVLKAIVSLIASINKQIAALQKALLKK